MKLRNKNTGEIKGVIVGGYPVSGKTKMWEVSEMDLNEETGYKSLGTYTSLAELNAEWEDYEEPKDYWYIYADKPQRAECGDILEEDFQAIGNYFETKEEAEKVVEKLKAVKRLKDNYFISFDLDFVKNTISFNYRIDGTLHSAVDEERIVFEDLKTIFGGEE